MPLRPPQALVALVLLLGACRSLPTILESDIPVPEGMQSIRSADIRRSGGEVVGGRFLLSGVVDDARDTVRSTSARFESAGWTVESSELGLDHAVAEFAKGARRVRLVVDRRALEPAMSSGLIEVRAASSAP
jgi:hypothetical protein